MEKKDWEQRIIDYSAALMDKHFPKGECKERGKALVFNAKLITYVMGELDKAREEGRREVLNKETFIGDYDILMQGLHIRTIDRENFLAQIYKTVKERYDWAFGTATYKQALKMIENSLTSPLTPYVGTDKMIDEARIEVLSKLTTK